jgi:hypothetical protein
MNGQWIYLRGLRFDLQAQQFTLSGRVWSFRAERAARRRAARKQVSYFYRHVWFQTYRYCYVLPYPIKKFFKFDKNRCYIRRMERLDAVPFVRPQILSLVARTRMCRITPSAISRRLHVTALLLTQCQNFGYTSYRNGAVSTSLACFLFLLMYIT